MLVFEKFLDPSVANQIVQIGESYARNHEWTKLRHKNYPTTDLPAYLLNELKVSLDNSNDNTPKKIEFGSWFNKTIEEEIFPLIYEYFHIPRAYHYYYPSSDSTLSQTILDAKYPSQLRNGKEEHSYFYELFCKDLFLVKYNANDETSQRHLEKHTDSSLFSFNIALSPHEYEYLLRKQAINGGSGPVYAAEDDREFYRNYNVTKMNDIEGHYYREGGTRFHLSFTSSSFFAGEGTMTVGQMQAKAKFEARRQRKAAQEAKQRKAAASAPVKNQDKSSNTQEEQRSLSAASNAKVDVDQVPQLASKSPLIPPVPLTPPTLTKDRVIIPQGSLMIHNSNIYHEGVAITKGFRYILVGFINLRIQLNEEKQQFFPNAKEIIRKYGLNKLANSRKRRSSQPKHTDPYAKDSVAAAAAAMEVLTPLTWKEWFYYQYIAFYRYYWYYYYGTDLFHRKFGQFTHCLQVYSLDYLRNKHSDTTTLSDVKIKCKPLSSAV